MQSRARIAVDFQSSRHSAENRHFQVLEFFNTIGRYANFPKLKTMPDELLLPAQERTKPTWLDDLRCRPISELNAKTETIVIIVVVQRL